MGLSVSVITPSFNQGAYIERTIQSVLNQNISGLEYVIMDGGSTDATSDIANRYVNRLCFVSEKDNGQADAVNKGISSTTGDIIGWLNSDDVYYPGALEAVVNYFETHKEANVVYGDAVHIDELDAVLESYYTEDWDYERLKDVCFLCQPAVFFRRRLMARAGMLDASLTYCMDYEYWLRLGKFCDFYRISRCLAGSRMYKENKTLGARRAVHREINDMLQKTIRAVPDRWIINYAHVIVEEKGCSRETPDKNMHFVHCLILVSLIAFLRWRYRIPVTALKTMVGWEVAALKQYAAAVKS
ncbi:MAG: glycosyltransferase family 2 protein [Deltaproteobacteria bacterium]|jgi:glycosyltransferase involved in cell wall biosynthesis